jgi:hypothetical protein
VGARAFDGNSCDVLTLARQIEQATILMQDTGAKPNTAWANLGCRGVDADKPEIEISRRVMKTRLTELQEKTLERRQAIEPVIGHQKADHRMGRCHLKGAPGGKLHAVPCAAGCNIRWLLRMIGKKGLRALLPAPRAMAAIAVRSEQRLGIRLHIARMRLRHRCERTSYTLAAGCNERPEATIAALPRSHPGASGRPTSRRVAPRPSGFPTLPGLVEGV